MIERDDNPPLRLRLPGRSRARRHRRALDDPDPARPPTRGAPEVSGFPAVAPRDQPEPALDRLRRLLEHGIVTREFYGEHPPRAQYALTDKGRALGPVLRTLRDWGTAHTRRTR